MFAKRLPFALLIAVAVLLPSWAYPTGWALPAAGMPTAPKGEGKMPLAGASPGESTAVQGRLSPEIWISEAVSMPEGDRHAPGIAANKVRGEYLVVWHNRWPDGRRDIYARRMTQNGRLLNWFAITTGTNDRMRPAATYNATDAEYLVVWMYDVSGNGTQYEIWGRIVAWDGSYQKPEFKVISWLGRSMSTPRVVWNPNRNQFLVVWTAFDTASPYDPTDVSSMLLDNQGNLVTGRVLTTSTFPHQVDVAYGSVKDEYFVVFVRAYPQATTGKDIYGLRVAHNNAVVMPPGAIKIHSGPQNQTVPRVTADSKGDYMVVWEYEFQPTDNDIYARKMDADGTPDGSWFALSNSGLDERSPAIAASFDSKPQYLAVWQQATSNGTVIAARRWGEEVTSEWLDIPRADYWEEIKPAVAASPPNYLIAFEGDATNNPGVSRQIYGHAWIRYALWLPLVVR